MTLRLKKEIWLSRRGIGPARAHLLGCPCFVVCRAKVSRRSQCESGPGKCRYALVATWEKGRVTVSSTPQGQRPVKDGSASVRAATRVKPEQAPKGTMRAPSLRQKDEGRRGRLDNRQTKVVLLAGVVGAARTHMRRFATRETCLGCPGGNASVGSRVQQESEGLIRPRNPGNAGGGKEP
jgi:hypothetical protein